MPIADHSYTSFLLRLWCAQQEDGRAWIACLQSTATGEQRRFPDLEALIQFLWDEYGDAIDDGAESGQAPRPVAQAKGTPEAPK
jgi:hypothetical protein